MYCKHCGNEMNPAESFCPKCGAANSLNGGNGFWDLAKGPAKAAPPREDASSTVFEIVKEENEPKMQQIFPIAVSAVLLLVCLIAILSVKNSTRKSIKELSAEIDALQNSQTGEYAAVIDALEEELSEQEEALEEYRLQLEALENKLSDYELRQSELEERMVQLEAELEAQQEINAGDEPAWEDEKEPEWPEPDI